MNVSGKLIGDQNRSDRKQSLPNLLKNGSRLEQSNMATERDSKNVDGAKNSINGDPMVGDGGSTAHGTIVKGDHATIVQSMQNSIPDQSDTPAPLKAGQESIKDTIPTIHEEEHEQDGDPRQTTIITSILKKDSQIKDSDKRSNITLSKESSYRHENAEMEPMTQRASGRQSNE